MILWLYQFLPSDSKPLKVRNHVYFHFGNHLSLLLVPVSSFFPCLRSLDHFFCLSMFKFADSPWKQMDKLKVPGI